MWWLCVFCGGLWCFCRSFPAGCDGRSFGGACCEVINMVFWVGVKVRWRFDWDLTSLLMLASLCSTECVV